ncbi:MAG: cytochrome c biogenesis protein CcdA [Pseudomonadota bacterium]
MAKVIKAFMALVALCIAGAAYASLSPDSPFGLSWDNKIVEVAPGNTFELKLTIRAPEGYYIYADETDVDFESLESLIVTAVSYPQPVSYTDPYLNKKVNVYRGDVNIVISGHVPEGLKAGERDLVARVSFRGCSPTLCYRAEERELSFHVEVLPAPGDAPSPAIEPMRGEEHSAGAQAQKSGGLSFKSLLKVQDFSLLMQRGIGWTTLIVFLAGILTSLTPCVWPIIPVVLAYIGVHPHKRFWENLLLSSTLISGLILVYAILGVIAVAAGKNLGFLFQHRLFLAIVVLFFLAMSFSMFGVFDVRMPRRWQHRLHSLGGQGYRGAFLAGMGTGLVASPCAGPVLAGLLGYVALQRNYAEGFALLVIYAMGMGLLIVLLGACYGELAGKLRGGPWMLWARRVLGLLLLFPAVFYMGSLFHWSPDRIGIFFAGPGIEWISSEADALRIASKTKKPVMIEFGAEWCPPCRELEAGFLRQSDIVGISRGLVALHVDATVETGEVRRLISKYHVSGWPTVLFLDSEGRPYKDLKTSDYDPGAIERGMKEAIKREEGKESRH